WLAFQTFGTDCFQIAIKSWRQAATFGRGVFSRLLNDLQRVLTYEWRSASQKVEQNRTQTINISRRRKLTRRPLHLFGRDVAWRPENAGCARQIAHWLQPFCQSEIADQRFAVAVQ